MELFSIDEILAKHIKISRPMLYGEMRKGRLKTVKIGSRRFITEQGLKDYFKLLKDEAKKAEWK